MTSCPSGAAPLNTQRTLPRSYWEQRSRLAMIWISIGGTTLSCSILYVCTAASRTARSNLGSTTTRSPRYWPTSATRTSP